VVATHEGEAGVRRAQREEDELPDPLGLHGGGSAQLGWGGVALLLGLHQRWPPVGFLVRNWEVRVGIWGERRRPAVRRVFMGAEQDGFGTVFRVYGRW
jgi:hypothetical protein